jgi:hypothetical protein
MGYLWAGNNYDMNSSKAEAEDIGVHILEKAMNPSKYWPFQNQTVHAAEDRQPSRPWRLPVQLGFFQRRCFGSVEK